MFLDSCFFFVIFFSLVIFFQSPFCTDLALLPWIIFGKIVLSWFRDWIFLFQGPPICELCLLLRIVNFSISSHAVILLQYMETELTVLLLGISIKLFQFKFKFYINETAPTLVLVLYLPAIICLLRVDPHTLFLFCYEFLSLLHDGGLAIDNNGF